MTDFRYPCFPAVNVYEGAFRQVNKILQKPLGIYGQNWQLMINVKRYAKLVLSSLLMESHLLAE